MQHPDINYKQHIHEATLYRGGSTRSEAGQSKIDWKLSSNESLFGPSPMVVEAIRQYMPSLHEYNFQDEACLTNALTEYFEHRLLRDQFFVGNGGMELIQMICGAFITPGAGQEAIISSPTFMAYKNFIDGAGGITVDVPLKAADYSLDIECILQNVNKATRLLFIASPNNPVGSIISIQEMNLLMDKLPRHVVVVYDEVYHHYVTDRSYARAINFIQQGKPIIGIHSFSKANGLASMRLAYGFSTIELSEYIQKVGRPFKINALATVAGIASLKDKAHIEKTVHSVNTEKIWLYGQFRELGIKTWTSHANFILFNPGCDIYEFEKYMEKEGIMVRTAEVFKAPGTIRVTVGTHEANLAFLLALRKQQKTL